MTSIPSNSTMQRLPGKRPMPDLARIKLLCCDVDGVLTDGGLYYNEQGHCMYKFHVLDGMGLQRLQAAGVKTCFISASPSPIISTRASKLGIDYCYIGCNDKLDTLKTLTKTLGISMDEVAHIADDVNDLELLNIVGTPVTVPNAIKSVLDVCRFITTREGGQGAVRELCDAILLAKAKPVTA